MKGLDVFIVRFLPFILFIITGVNIVCCALGIDVRDSYALHSHSVLYSLSLFLISLCNRRYHCIWNRAMYVFLILVPCLNYIDKKIDILPYNEWAYIVIAILYVGTMLITAYLAIRHFVQASKRRLERQLPRETKTRGLKEAQVD